MCPTAGLALLSCGVWPIAKSSLTFWAIMSAVKGRPPNWAPRSVLCLAQEMQSLWQSPKG